MSNILEFTDNSGSFKLASAGKIRAIYFPLCNERIMSSVTPFLAGDIKAGQDAFLMPPASRIDLINSRYSRNFWVYFDKDKIWSVSGCKDDLAQVDAGLLWHKLTRQNKKLGIKVEVLSFIPSSGEPAELMQVKLTNICGRKISFIPTAAIPMYCRGANNIRDHRHVTSLLQRVSLHKFGVICKPTLSFDESGHRPNENYYFVLGWDDSGKGPQHIYPAQEGFCGEAGDLESPRSVLENLLPCRENIQGKEPMGGLRFSKRELSPGKSCTFTVAMGVTAIRSEISGIIRKFNSLEKVSLSLESTKKHWLERARRVGVRTADADFNNWFLWVGIQPVLRKIFGCSFLPDFDYGKGGRGWRDLWQDCLGLILSGSKEARHLLINNFSGVRVDGSNATIIGKKNGEFIADRNDIPRVWMDHGVWPLLTTELYIKESKNTGILFEKAGYFSDQHIFRCRRLNKNFKPCKYKGTLLEHLLLQNLAQFYNVGPHNHIRLEGGDWNDGLDMASLNGESVAFSCMYAANLKKLAQLIRASGRKSVSIFAEMGILLKACDYESVALKNKRLNDYFSRVSDGISGKTASLNCADLASNLEEKAEWMLWNIRRKEWLKEGFFNGYYDNRKKRVEGRIGGRIRMTLTAQAFAVMSGIAQDWQVKKIISSVDKYLFDKRLKGYRLNTDFGEEQHNLGRAFSFSYGDKENGAVFSHMVVMYAYALLSRGYKKEAEKALDSLYRLSMDFPRSKIYPCLPEYFDLNGGGMYSYLTGSASWFLLTCSKHNRICN